MSSIDATNVAYEVLENIGKPKKLKLGKIALKNGYSKNTADNPKLITKTKSYQRVIAPVLKRYQNELDEVLLAMSLKDKNTEQYKTLVEAVDKLQRQIQLLSGGATENIATGVEITIRR